MTVRGVAWRVRDHLRSVADRAGLRRDLEREGETVQSAVYEGAMLVLPEQEHRWQLRREWAWLGQDPPSDPFKMFPGKSIEVGCDIGASLLKMQRAKPHALYLCFEPSSRFLPLLERTVDANGWRNVTVELFALGSSQTDRRLFTNATSASIVVESYYRHELVGSETVRTTTLDAYFRDFRPVDFLKIDIDGFEYESLAGRPPAARPWTTAVRRSGSPTRFARSTASTDSRRYACPRGRHGALAGANRLGRDTAPRLRTPQGGSTGEIKCSCRRSDWKAILVNGGATDESPERLSASSRTSAFLCLRPPNQGNGRWTLAFGLMIRDEISSASWRSSSGGFGFWAVLADPQ